MKNGITRIIFASKSVLKPVVETGDAIVVSGVRAVLGENDDHPAPREHRLSGQQSGK